MKQNQGETYFCVWRQSLARLLLWWGCQGLGSSPAECPRVRLLWTVAALSCSIQKTSPHQTYLFHETLLLPISHRSVWSVTPVQNLTPLKWNGSGVWTAFLGKTHCPSQSWNIHCNMVRYMYYTLLHSQKTQWTMLKQMALLLPISTVQSTVR